MNTEAVSRVRTRTTLDAIAAALTEVERAILATPTGAKRAKLTEAQIHLMQAQIAARVAKEIDA